MQKLKLAQLECDEDLFILQENDLEFIKGGFMATTTLPSFNDWEDMINYTVSGVGAGFQFTNDVTKIAGFVESTVNDISHGFTIAGRVVSGIQLGDDAYNMINNGFDNQSIAKFIADGAGAALNEVPVVGTVGSIIYSASGANTYVANEIDQFLNAVNPE